ncbi:MAG: DUF1622 domain-containing protein [Actinobacteria bacterium]|nr:DUF1622 domain-containing protein [Actinomycetota bacterium]
MPGWYADLVTYWAIPVLVALGVLAAALCAVRGNWRAGVGLGLDLWLAAGLLTLGVATPWTSIATVAVIVAVRHLATWSIDRAGAARQAGA